MHVCVNAHHITGNAAQVQKVKCQEKVDGNYSVEFKILTASPALQFRLRVLNRVVFVKTVESLAGPAKAKTSVSIHIYVYVFVYSRVGHMYMSIYIYIYVYSHMYTHIFTCIYLYISISICIYMYIHLSLSLYINK